MKSLKGVFPALLTPFDGANRINEKVLRELVQINMKKGVDGFYVGGSTGEAFLLSLDERKHILEIVIDEVRGRSTIISHVGSISTDWSIELAMHAKEVGADAVSSIPPFYYKFSSDEILGHYMDIVDTVDVPMIVYNYPAFSGVILSAEKVRLLREHPGIIGIKHTSTDLFQLESMKKADPNLLVFNGYDEIFLAGFSMGADGAIGSTFNFMAEKFIAIRQMAEEGQLTEARKVQSEANEVIRVLMQCSSLNAHKYILEFLGVPCGVCRRPFKPLSEEQKVQLKQVAKKFLLPVEDLG